MEYRVNNHSCFLLQYHIVLVTKYRRPVLTGNIRAFVYEKIQTICSRYHVILMECNGEENHIHLLVETKPTSCISSFVNVLKTQTSKKNVRLKFKETLKEWYWKPVFWKEGYFVCTLSEHSTKLVKKYIQNQ